MKHNNINFHTLAVGCNHLNTKTMLLLSEKFNHHLSFTTYIDNISRKHFFHVFLISQKINNYLEVTKKLKIEFPNSIFIIIVEDLSNIENIINSNELFFILHKEHLDYSLYQLWHWIITIETKKIGLHQDNSMVTIANGALSLIEETYQRIDKIYQLTRKQMAILKILLEYRGEPVSRDILIERIWISEQKVVTDRIIDTNIVALRKMFGDNGRNPKYIQTIFGQGYKLTLE